MKPILAFVCLVLLSCTFLPPAASAQNSPLSGAWSLVEKNGQPLSVGMNIVMILTDNYVAWSCYDRVSKKYYYTGGGVCQTDGRQIKIKFEFNSRDSTQVGTAVAYDYVVNKKRLAFSTDEGDLVWERLDAARDSDLAGVWRITGREQDGKMTTMPASARKTIKILSGTRFQWIALNPETKQVFGTGGGTYVLKNGRYTETIEFFPRDPQRVGMSLTFDAALTGRRWQHKGKSTAGSPVHETWEKQ